MPPKFDPNEIKQGIFLYFLLQHAYNNFKNSCNLINNNQKIIYIFKIVYLRCVGGEVGATSSLAPKIGPLGLVSL